MNIGLFCGNYSQESGGGSTFETEILLSLEEFGKENGYTFTLFGWDSVPPKEVDSASHVDFVSLNSAVKKHSHQHMKTWERWKTRLKLWGKQAFGSEYSFAIPSTPALSVKAADMMWYVTPFRCLTLDIPYITTVWDLQHRLQPYFPEVSSEERWSNRERFYAEHLRRAAYILTGTERGKAEIELFYQIPSERIKVLPFPTPKFALQKSSPPHDVRIKYQLPEQYLFYPAQFWPHKNHVGLLRALKWLAETYHQKIPVVFIGSDQGNQSYIRQVVRDLHLSDQVYFIGFVPQDDLIALYAQAFLLPFVSFFGPDNLPPLEAFALGCPVIATLGFRELRNNWEMQALFVDPKDETQIALAIKTIYENPGLRQTLKQRGLERASKWTGYHYVQGVLSILDNFAAIRRCWSPATSLTIKDKQEWFDSFPQL